MVFYTLKFTFLRRFVWYKLVGTTVKMMAMVKVKVPSCERKKGRCKQCKEKTEILFGDIFNFESIAI